MINRVTLLGNVGSKTELRETSSGLAVINISLATSEKKKDGDEVTEWHRLVCFGDLASNFVDPFVEKGDMLYIEGKIQSSIYTDKDGNEKDEKKIMVKVLQKLNPKKAQQDAMEYNL